MRSNCWSDSGEDSPYNNIMLSFLITFGLIGLSIGLWIFFVAKRGFEFKKLCESGLETKATIVTKTSVRVGKKRRPALTYEFNDPMGTTQRRRVYVTQAVYDLSQEGASTAVVYLPEKPSVNALKSDVDAARRALAKKLT